MYALHQVLIVAADHPSLDADVERFVAELGADSPPASLVHRVWTDEQGFRLAALIGGRVVGVARVDRRGEVWLAVAPGHRGRGIGSMLARAVADRARDRGLGHHGASTA